MRFTGCILIPASSIPDFDPKKTYAIEQDGSTFTAMKGVKQETIGASNIVFRPTSETIIYSSEANR